MSFLTAASDRLRGGLSGGVSGPSFFGTASFCGVALVLIPMSLSRAGAAREVRKWHMLHDTRAKRSVILIKRYCACRRHQRHHLYETATSVHRRFLGSSQPNHRLPGANLE